MQVDQLHPPGPPIEVDSLLASLRPWERAPGGRPLVMVNMVQTADGLITIGGKSGPIGGEGDHAMFHGLRSVVDAILVGTGTLRAEKYGRMIRRPERRALRASLGLQEDPLAILITQSGNLPWDAPLFAEPLQRVVIAGPCSPPPLAAQVTVIGSSTPADALRTVHSEFGVRAVLCEGGPTLNRALLGDGVLDELFLTVAPKLAGDDEALRILAGDALAEPVGMELRHVLHHEGELFLRYAL